MPTLQLGTDLENKINSLIDAKINASVPTMVFNRFFPVGSTYISFDKDFDPNTWGGTWSKISDGYFLEPTTTDSKVGTNVNAGLPNIAGNMTYMQWNNPVGFYNFGTTGAFYNYNTNPSGRVTAEDTYWASGSTSSSLLGFDASRSNNIYGKSSTVQPKSTLCYMWKRTA